jgi:hypothetical protein
MIEKSQNVRPELPPPTASNLIAGAAATSPELLQTPAKRQLLMNCRISHKTKVLTAKADRHP